MSSKHTNLGDAAAADPVALLGSFQPPSGWNRRITVSGPNANQQAARTLARVLSGSVAPVRRPRNGLRLVTSIVVALSLGGAVAAAVLWERSPDQISALACWSEPANPPSVQVGVEWDGVEAPIDRCAEAWTRGPLGTTGPPDGLQVCVTDAGTAAVVPGDVACNDLGMARFVDPSTNPDVDNFATLAELEARLSAEINLGPCNEVEDAVAIATGLITELELEGWEVKVSESFSDREPCATAAVDTPNQTVFIVPLAVRD